MGLGLVWLGLGLGTATLVRRGRAGAFRLSDSSPPPPTVLDVVLVVGAVGCATVGTGLLLMGLR